MIAFELSRTRNCGHNFHMSLVEAIPPQIVRHTITLTCGQQYIPNAWARTNLSKFKVTLVDFTVTQKGLEEQLLGRVIGKEQKALEEQLSDVLEEVNSNTKVPLPRIEHPMRKLSSRSVECTRLSWVARAEREHYGSSLRSYLNHFPNGMIDEAPPLT